MVKFAARKIQDPMYGKGFEAYASTEKINLSVCPTIGLCDRLLGFELELTPPFDSTALNEGEEGVSLGSGYIWKTFGLQVSFLYINLAVQFHIINN